MTLSTFTHNVLEMDPILFLSYVFWAGVGVLLSLLLHANQRAINNNNMQMAFCWKFLFTSNYKRILISFLLILVSIRFSKQLIGLEQNAFSSFVIGLCSDHLGKVLQLKILVMRDKQLKPKQNE